MTALPFLIGLVLVIGPVAVIIAIAHALGRHERRETRESETD